MIFLSFLGILIIIIAVIVKFMVFPIVNRKENRDAGKKTVSNGVFIALFIIGIGLFILGNSFAIINTGYTGVKTTFGQIDSRTYSSGFQWKIPFVQEINIMNNKQQDISFDNSLDSETSERNKVLFSGITVTYRINPEKSAWIYTNVSNYEDNLITEDLVSSGIKTSSKKLSPNQVTDRSILEPKAKEEIQKSIDEKYGENVVFITKVVIKNAEFDEEYNKKIAQKQQAQMEYETQQIENKKNIEKAESDAKVKTTNAQAEAEAKLIEAEAESKANKKLAESITDKLIEEKLAEARLKHGWVTVQGSDTVVTNVENDEKNVK